MIGPAIVLAHGPRGVKAAKRAVALARPSSVVRRAEINGLDASADELAAEIEGQSRVDAIHFVDTSDAPAIDALLRSLHAVTESAAKLPALYFQQWVIAMVGEDWDDEELRVREAVGHDLLGTGLLIVGRSNEARGLISEDDEVGMASDLALALMSTDLRLSIGPPGGGHWTAGAASVMYRRRLIVAALAAYHARQFIEDTLLAPMANLSAYGAMGRRWGEELGLANDVHHELLSRGATGGSAFTDLVIREDAFAKTPFEFLSDALQSYFEQLAAGMLSRSKEQIDRNVEAHSTELKADLDRRTVDVLRQSLTIESTDDYLKNIVVGIAELIEGVRVQIAAAEGDLPARYDAIRRELERTIRKLPYPAAIAARAAGYASVGVVTFLLIQDPLNWPAGYTPIGLAVGGALAAPLYVRYLFGVAKIHKLRRKFLREVEMRLRAEAELHLLRKMLDELTGLQEFVATGDASLQGRLRELRHSVDTLRDIYEQREVDRISGDLVPTPYSIFVPRAEDMSTESLVRQFPLPRNYTMEDAVLRAILPRETIERLDLERADELIVDAVALQIDQHIWRSLDALLAQAPATRQRIIETLATRVSPIVRRADFVPKEDEIRRLLYIDKATNSTAMNALGTTIDFDGNLPHRDPNSIHVVALRDASFESGGDNAAD